MSNASPPGTKTLSLRKNLFWGVSGNIFFALTQWLVLIALAKLGTPEDVGMLTLVTALVTPVFMFGELAMNDAHTVDDLSEFRRADYFALRFVGALTATAICFVLSLIWFNGQDQLLFAAFAYLVLRFVGSQMQLNQGVFQREQRVDLVARSNVWRGIGGALIFALVFWVTQALWPAILGQALVWFAVLILIDRRYLAQLGVADRFRSILPSDASRLLRLFLWLLPLALTALLVNATISVPRLVLGATADLSAVGVFGAIAFIDTGFGIAINAIGFASASRLRSTVRSGQRRRFILLSLALVAITTAIGLTLFALGILFGEQILTLLYGTEYVDMHVLTVIIGATALRSAFVPLQVSLTAGHVLWRRFFINVLAFAATLIGALVLVPEMGALGAALSFLIGIAIRCALLLAFFIRLVVSLRSPD